jgi:tRNA pseudouridine55 synthase
MKNGIILIDKPEDITSYDVIRKLKKVFKTGKIGHAGTLDPFATGLLVVAIGKATRILEYLSSKDKAYEFELRLGIKTDSFDITGKVIEENDFSYITKEKLEEVLDEFKGEILQVPPIFSAKKIKGERLYEKARRGEIINIPPSKVKIHEIRLLDFKPPDAKIMAKVSKGTYIRSLVQDIGLKLGCGATTTKLRRIEVGKFNVKDSIPLDKVNENTKLLSIDEVLDFPRVIVKDDFVTNLLNGQSPKGTDIKSCDNFKKDDLVKILSENNEFLAIGMAKRNSNFIEKMEKLHPNEGAIKIKKVFKEK